MTITNILISNMPQLIKGEKLNPTDEVLDKVWAEMKANNRYIVSEAIEAWGTDKFDMVLDRYIESGSLKDAIELRKYTKACFRDFARSEVTGYESSIMAAHEHGVGMDNLPEYNAETASYV